MPVKHAENVIFSTYGDTVSVAEKKKSLNKFGGTTVGTSFTTVQTFQGSEINETYVSTNLIDSISSSSAADTSKTYTIEGHTIDGSGNLTFVVQDATTNASDGRTKVTLGTPLARATRLYLKDSGTFNSPQTAGAGVIYVYDDTGGVTNGVPNTAAATKIMLAAGSTQSLKASTSTSSQDYWIITSFSATIEELAPSADYVEFRIEWRRIDTGGAWRPLGRELVVLKGGTPANPEPFNPYRIIPKNSDIRIVARSNTGTADVYAEAEGYLAVITS